jgi:putative SOS response-associated peptidase YedK
MCNLYTISVTPSEIADEFDAVMDEGFNAGAGDIYKGGQGMVVLKRGGRQVLKQMTWGFPLPQKSKKTGLPIKPTAVNNIAELTAYPWHFIAPNPEKRCIIPATGFCEAEGQKGRMTRTWFALKERPIFAWAGMWGYSDEWGDWYSGFMTNCNEFVRPVHNRMPVLLHEDDYERWLHGSLDDVIYFRDRCFPDDAMTMDRTDDLWFRKKTAV